MNHPIRDLRLRILYDKLQDQLDQICAWFENPKVTLVIRAPDLVDGDIVIGNDDLDLAIVAIERLKGRKPQFEPPPAETSI